MPRLTFPNGEFRDLPVDTPQEYVNNLVNAYHEYGSLRAVDQWIQLDGLRQDPGFLQLPRLERHRIFNEFVSASPDFWNFEKMTPDRRRVYRDHIVEAEGSNPQEAFDYWNAPIQFKDEIGKATDGILAEFVHAFQRSAPQVTAHLMSGFTNLAAEAVEQLTPGAKNYLAPLADPEAQHRAAAETATSPEQPGGIDGLAKLAREMASDAAIGAETLAPPPKVGTFGEVEGWDSFTMYLAKLAGEQVPVLGSILAAGMIPGVGTAAAYATGAALETGSILHDLERQGMDTEAARGTAALYGTLAGALEALPVANFLKRAPGSGRIFQNTLLDRLTNAGIQALEEAGTEGLQTLVEQTAVDVVNAERGNLEAISWLTPEGRRSLWDEAQEAMIAGGLMGGGLGVLGRTGKLDEDAAPTPEPDTTPEVEGAAETQPAPPGGPLEPEIGGMPEGERPTGPPITGTEDATEREVALALEREGFQVEEEEEAETPKQGVEGWSEETWKKFKTSFSETEEPFPWEETQDRFVEAIGATEEQREEVISKHRRWIEAALERGETVPDEVLKEYPDLQEAPTTVPESQLTGRLGRMRDAFEEGKQQELPMGEEQVVADETVIEEPPWEGEGEVDLPLSPEPLRPPTWEMSPKEFGEAVYQERKEKLKSRIEYAETKTDQEYQEIPVVEQGRDYPTGRAEAIEAFKNELADLEISYAKGANKVADGENHKDLVAYALSQGNVVPEKVIEAYPDLKEQNEKNKKTSPAAKVVPIKPEAAAAPADLTDRIQKHPDIVDSAKADRKKLSKEAEDDLHKSEMGIFKGQMTPLDRQVSKSDEIYKAFEATRKLLRDKFGDTITLYRAEHVDEADRRVEEGSKTTLNWASKPQAELFLDEQFGKREIISKEIPVDDIVAVNVGTKGKYEEFVVVNREAGLPEWMAEPEAAAAPEAAAKEPWQMTADEYGAIEYEKTRARVEAELKDIKSKSAKQLVDEGKIGKFSRYKTKAEAIRQLTGRLEKMAKDLEEVGASMFADHYAKVAQAVREGKAVPQEILDAYPDIAKDAETAAEQLASDVGTIDGDLEFIHGSEVMEPLLAKKTLQAALPGWAIRTMPGGVYRMVQRGHKPITVRFVDNPIEESFRGKTAEQINEKIKHWSQAYGIPESKIRQGIRNQTFRFRGYYGYEQINGTHVMVLSKTKAAPETIFHEAFHFAFSNVLTPAQRMQVLDFYGSEEKAAREYGKMAEIWAKQDRAGELGMDRKKALNPAERQLLAIWEWAKGFVKAMWGENYLTGQEIMEEIFSGKIWEQAWLGRAVTSAEDPFGFKRYVDGGGIRDVILDIGDAETFDDHIKEALKPETTWEALKKAYDAEQAVSIEDGDLAQQNDPDPTVTYGPDMAVGGDGNTQDPAMVPTRELVREWMREHVTRKLADKLGPIEWLQEKLTGLGIEISESLDGYLKARNFQGRAGARLKWLDNTLFAPLRNKIAELDIDLRAFDEFRMALRSLELNPHLYRMHVVIPKAALQKKIEQIKKSGIRKGNVVRIPNQPNLTGKVTKVDGDTVHIKYRDPDSLEWETEEFHQDHVKRDALAEAEEKLKKIEEMVKNNDVPHAGMQSPLARQTLRNLRDVGLIEFDGEPNNKTKYSGDLMQVSRLFDKIVHWKEETLLSSGLITEEELKAWRKTGKHYAPMRGKAVPDILDYLLGGDRPPLPNVEPYGGKMWHRAVNVVAKAMGHEGEVFQPNIGRGYNPGKRKASRRALGRHSLPTHSPTAELMTDAMELAVRAERNRVAKTMLNLFKSIAAKGLTDENGRPLIIIDEAPKKRVYDEKTKTVKVVNDNLALNRANVYDIWIDGEHHYVRTNSTDMAGVMAVLNNVGPESAPQVLRTFAGLNRWIAKMATSRNPAFAIPNLIRDLTAAGIRLTSDTQYQKLGVNILKSVPKNIKLLAEYARLETKGKLDEMDPEIRKRIEKFKLAGGETAFWMVPRLDTTMKNLHKDIDRAAKRDSRIFRGIRSVVDLLEDYNGALEATTRFAVFEAALEKGLSEDKAAKLAREITVDFTMQGEWAGWMGSLWVFSNASIQGTRMVYQTLWKTEVGRKKWLPGLIALGMSHALLMRYAGGEDEEDETPYWDKITDYEKSRNLILMNPFSDKGQRLKIPLPWGFNFPLMAGQMMMDVFAKGKKPVEGAMAVLSSGLSAFNPIGDNDLTELSGWYQMVAPSWLDPTTDLVLNRTFWGGPIMPDRAAFKKSEQYGIPQKDHTRYFSSATEFSKWATKGIYKAFGISISPETLDYTVAAWAGGLGDTVQKSINLPLAVATRHKLASNEYPVIRSFYATDSPYYAPQLYRANMGHYWEKYETARDMKKEGDPGTGAYQARWGHILALKPQVKLFEEQIKALRKAGVTQDDSRMQRLYKKFNLLYDRTEANRRRQQKKNGSIMK